MAGNARTYSDPGWDRSHLAQALADASAEAIANMGPEDLRNSATKHSCCFSLNGAASAEGVAEELRQALTLRAQQCRTEIFGDPAMGALDLSACADIPDDYLHHTDQFNDGGDESDLEGGEHDHSRGDGGSRYRPRQAAQGSPMRRALVNSNGAPGRLDKEARDYMVHVLTEWCERNPGFRMPGKEEKEALVMQCSMQTGTQFTTRSIEYWFWQRNKMLKQSGQMLPPRMPPRARPGRRHSSGGAAAMGAPGKPQPRRVRKETPFGPVMGEDPELQQAEAKAARLRFEQQAPKVAERYRRHLQEAPLVEQLSSGGRAQGNGLRLRPLNIKQPMVVVQPLNERAPNQKSPQKDGGGNHLAPPEPTDPPPGAEDGAKAGAAAAAPAETSGKAEQIFCPKFTVSSDYEQLLEAQLTKGKQKRAAPTDDAGSTSEEEPPVPRYPAWVPPEGSPRGVFRPLPPPEELEQILSGAERLDPPRKRSRGGYGQGGNSRRNGHANGASGGKGMSMAQMEAAAEAETESDSTRSPNAEAAEHEQRRQGGWQKQRRGRPEGNKIWDGWSGSWVEMPTDEGAAAQMPPAGSSDDMGIELSDAASALPSAAVGSSLDDVFGMASAHRGVGCGFGDASLDGAEAMAMQPPETAAAIAPRCRRSERLSRSRSRSQSQSRSRSRSRSRSAEPEGTTHPAAAAQVSTLATVKHELQPASASLNGMISLPPSPTRSSLRKTSPPCRFHDEKIPGSCDRSE